MAEEEENLEAEIVYPITCGDSRANLIWRKFVCPGINVKCVQVRAGRHVQGCGAPHGLAAHPAVSRQEPCARESREGASKAGQGCRCGRGWARALLTSRTVTAGQEAG